MDKKLIMEKNQELYESLLLQYEKISELEKNAILIYKSKLFVIINSITKIPDYEKLTTTEIINNLPNKDECLTVFNEYSKVLSDLKNTFIKNSIFSNIRFDNIDNFINDIKIIIDIINKISFKIVLEEDMVVYRSILVEENKQFDFINDSPNFISTSICRKVFKW